MCRQKVEDTEFLISREKIVLSLYPTHRVMAEIHPAWDPLQGIQPITRYEQGREFNLHSCPWLSQGKSKTFKKRFLCIPYVYLSAYKQVIGISK